MDNTKEIKMKVKITNNRDSSIHIFTLSEDGWWETNGFAINPSKTKCITAPWLADYICPAPTHKFKILEVGCGYI